MASVTSICNQALSHLGESPITSIEESSVEGRSCKLHYDITRDEQLRAHRWNFAQDRAILSRLSTTPVFGWSYQYRLPVDCLRALELNGSADNDHLTDPWIVEGRNVLTNAEAARLIYTRQETDPSLYDSLFVKTFALALAIKLTEVIRGTTSKTSDLVSMYEQLDAPEARRMDANEGKGRRKLISNSSPLLRARSHGAYGRVDPDTLLISIEVPAT